MHTGRIGNWRSCSGDCCRGGRRSRRWQTRTAVAAVSIWPNGGELDKSWLIRADVGVDPGLVTGYSGVDSRQIGPSTAKTKTNNSRLNPPVSLFADHWTSRVTLRRRRGGVWGCQKMGNIVWTSIKQSTWHESFPPARTPAQIMLSVIVPTPFRQLHCLFPTTGTCTSCRVWGNGNDTEETTTWQTLEWKAWWQEHWSPGKDLWRTSRLTSLIHSSPASDPAVGSIVEHTVIGCQTHWSDVVCECDRWRELEQSNIVVATVAVIVWV